MKHSPKHMIPMFFFSLLAALLLLSGSRAEAATAYQHLFEDYEKTEEKVGGTWFRQDDSKLYYSRDGKNYSLVAEGYHTYFTNGTLVLYADSKTYKLYRSSCNTGKTKVLKSLPTETRKYDPDYYNISTIYQNQVFLTRSSFEAWKYWTYQYHLKTGKLTRVLNPGLITARASKYVIVCHDYTSDVSPVRLSLYRITGTGLKKVVQLAKRGLSASFVKGHVYYGAYSKKALTKLTIYRRKQDGSALTNLGTITGKGMLIPYNYTSKYCLISIDGINYKYTYKTKKLTKVS